MTNLTTALIAVGSTAKKTAESGAIEKVSKGFALSAIALPALPPLFIKLANAIMKIGTGNAYKASIIMQRIGEILANWENVGMAPKLPAFFESLFTGISKISGAITKLFVLAGKIPWLGVLFRAGAETFALYIEGILIAWDTMRIKMSQISWWEALGLAVIRASARLGDFVAMLIPFWDPKLVEQFDKQMSKWKTWSRWLDSEADKKSKKLSTPEVTTPDTPAFLSGVEPTAEATKQLEDWQKTVLDHKIELMDYMAKEYILAKNLAIAYKEVADAHLKGVSLKEMPTAGYETFIPFSKIATPAYKDTRFSGDVAAENAMGVATVQLAENRKQVLANAEAFRRLGDSGKYTKEQMAQLANILGIETPKAMSGWEIASQALYNVGSAMQSLLQVQQNLRAADEAEHQRKMERLNTELDAIREQGFQYTEFYRNKEKLANQENKEHVKTMSRMFKFQRAVNTITAVMDSYLGFNSVMKDSTLPTLARLVIAPSVLAMGLANAYAIASQPTPKFATGGRIGGNPYGDNTTVLAQGGEFITNQRATRRNLRTLESINNGVNMDGGSGISVNITGNVIGSREFVRDTLVPEIRKALRDGYTIA